MHEFIWNELALLAEAMDRLQHNLDNCVGRSEYRAHVEAQLDELAARREHLVAALSRSVPDDVVEPELVGFEADGAAGRP